MAKNGDFYWVFAHVTPSFDARNRIVAYHSNRRCPRREAIAKIEPVYRQLLDEENRHQDRKKGMQASHAMLVDLLTQNGIAYDEFVFSL